MGVKYLEFIETRIFTKARQSLLSGDEEFHELQIYLLEHHDSGNTISHTGGCKKIRWNRPGMGKQGGSRVIYYTRLISRKIYLITYLSQKYQR